MRLLVALDIDGTLADMKWRHDLAGREPNKKNWKLYKKWLRRIQSKKMILKDRPVPGMRDLALLLQKQAVYITARNDLYRTVTKQWLKKNGFPSLKLYMRPKNNRESAGVFKEKTILDILHKSKSFLHVIIIDDDQKRDIAMACRRNNWTMLRAESGS